jgi:hypothetical protein
MLKTPKYIKSLLFDNQSGESAKVTVSFQSGKTETFNLPTGADTLVKNSIGHDTYNTVDPILHYTVEAKGKSTHFNN